MTTSLARARFSQHDRYSDAVWLDALAQLATRCSWLGLTPDLAGMSISELWAVYRFLQHVSGD